MRLHPSFYVHQFNSSKRLEALRNNLEAAGITAEVFDDFKTGETGAVYVGILLNPEGAVTHICRLQRGKIAGLDLRSIYLDDIQKIDPIEAEVITNAIQSSFYIRRKRRELYSGLKLTKGENSKIITSVEQTNQDLAHRLRSVGRADLRILRAYTDREAETLVLEREALGAAMEIALESREYLRITKPSSDKVDGFLALVDAVPSIEDEFIMHDRDRFPDMQKLDAATSRRATFVRGGKQLEVIHANRNRLETALGADLIYYNATLGAILCVQYKVLEKLKEGLFFQPNKDFHKQLEKMKAIENEASKISSSNDESDYRLNSGPFFYKFVSRLEKNFTDNALCPGLYMPLELVDQLASAGPFKRIGQKDDFVSRHFSNSEFATLVRSGWIGCHGSQISLFEKLIEISLKAGRSVIAAIGSKR